MSYAETSPPLCRDMRVNLAYRWFCGLSIEDKIPDHSAFSRARNERFYDSGIFRSVFERVVGACIAAGLVARLTAFTSSSLFHCGPGIDRCLLASAIIRLASTDLIILGLVGRRSIQC